MGQIAIVLLILGFGTFVLNAFNYEFRILSWADDYQPWFSLGLGVLGLIILVAKFAIARSKADAAPQPTGAETGNDGPALQPPAR